MCSFCSVVFVLFSYVVSALVFALFDCVRTLRLYSCCSIRRNTTTGRTSHVFARTKEKKKDIDDKEDERQVPKMFLVSTQCFFLFYNNPMCWSSNF